jgi:ABC-type Na+ efflux pump permease subunit
MVTFNSFNINLKYDLVSLPSYVIFVFLFSCFIIVILFFLHFCWCISSFCFELEILSQYFLFYVWIWI